MRQSSTTTLLTTGTGEGVLDVKEDDIPSASMSAPSLVTPRTERITVAGGGLVGSIFCSIDAYVHLPCGLFSFST